MRRGLLSLAVSVLVCALPGVAFGAALGGPTRNESSDTLVGLNPDTVWTSTFETTTTSAFCAPEVASGRIFVNTGTGAAETPRVLRALDATTHATLWTSDPLQASPLRDCPTADAGHVLQVVDSATVRSYAPATGAEQWERTLPGGQLSAPILAGGRVFVHAGDGTLHALDATDGTTLWDEPVPYENTQAPVLLAGGNVIVANAAGLTALSAATGAAAWTLPMAGGTTVGAAIIADDDVVLASGTDTSSTVRRMDGTAGTPVWTTSPLPGRPGLVADATRVYAAGSDAGVAELRTIDLATGATQAGAQDAPIGACPVRYGDQVLTTTRAFGANAATGTRGWDCRASTLNGTRLLTWRNGQLVELRDTSGPQATLSPANGSAIADTTPSLTWDITDVPGGVGLDPSTAAIRLDGVFIGGIPNDGYTPSTPLAEGTHTLTAQATDRNGNTGTTTSTFRVDSLGPGDPQITKPDNLAFVGDSFTLEGSATDAGGGPVAFEVTRSGSGQPPVTITGCEDGCSGLISGVPEGLTTYVIVAVDALGNRSNDVLLRINGDQTPPTAPALRTPADGATVTPGDVVFDWDDANELGGSELILDGTAYAATGSTLTRSVAAGVHTWKVRVTDRAGNATETGERSFTAKTPDPPAVVTPPASTPTPPVPVQPPAPPRAPQRTAAAAPPCASATPVEQTYDDASGDVAAAPDLRGMVVTVDASCAVTIQYVLDDTVLVSDDSLTLGVDADGDAGTGLSEDGTDRFLNVRGPASDLRGSIAIADGPRNTLAGLATPAPTFEPAAQRSIVVRTTVAALGLYPGRTARLSFGSIGRVNGRTASDFAPEGGRPGFALTVPFGTAAGGSSGGGATSTKPRLSGTAKVGKRLTCAAPKGAKKVKYRWLRNGKAIGKQTKKTLKLGKADAGKKVGCEVRATVAGKAVKLRSPTKKVARR